MRAGTGLVLAGLLASALPSIALARPHHETDKRAVADLAPSLEVARQRGPAIFNAVYDAMRQWGSSLHHNGMSFFLATVPEGVLLHHGNGSPDSPTDPDWLAYEIEHAEHFARGGRPGGPGGPGRGGPPGGGDRDDDDGPPGEDPPEARPPHGPYPSWISDEEMGKQHAISDMKEYGELKAREERHGYLHAYRTTRPLRFLYVDGMGGGKTSMGTLDSQDYLLRGQRGSSTWDAEKKLKKAKGKRAPGGPMDEQARARDFCKLCKEWGLQGVIRMEAGFEIIKCDFSDGLDHVQVLQRPEQTERGGPPGGLVELEFIRGLAERYFSIGSSRTIIDYSSMVSAYFFPVNLTNPDPKRQDLPRLTYTTDEELVAIKAYLNNTIEERQKDNTRVIDWQDVADLIVGRYADRVKYMTEKVDSLDVMKGEISFLVTVFIDGSQSEPDIPAAIDRCTNFYLQSISPVTESDRLIHAAFQTVTSEICSSLFKVHDIVSSNTTKEETALQDSVDALRSLIQYLQWTRFKRCPPCAINEVCLIPMWPMGTMEDYNSPRCTNVSDERRGDNYWGGFGGPGGGRRSPGDGDHQPPPRF